VVVRYSFPGGGGADFADGSMFGTEVSRQFVPEPAAAWLVALGLGAALARRAGR
jgi:hypothetical protein